MSSWRNGKQGRKRQRSVSSSDGPASGDDSPQIEMAEAEEAPPVIFRSRAYQDEMLAESLRQNIIVAMDTGSGKTQIAILRMREELMRCSSHKLVWFIAPTVALAEQQHSVISKQLPAFQTRFLSGADNVDRWSTQKIWDGILLNIKIVVSTPQVLLDALSNGFLTLRRVALLVFDEAHHCTASAPANRIMQYFYHGQSQQLKLTNDLPYVLGLTASPITRISDDALRELETNLNAVCKTPRIHREEMMRFVHLPELRRIRYQRNIQNRTVLEAQFAAILENMDINEDPLVKRLVLKDDYKSQAKLTEALTKRKTPCLLQLKRCFSRTALMCEDLGPWAAETFFSECSRRLRDKHTRSIDEQWTDWDKDDNIYLSEALSRVPMNPTRGLWSSIPDEISAKTNLLIDLLATEYTPTSTGIIFVEQRVTAVMLTHLLSMHPKLGHIIPGSFLGNSIFSSRTGDITELTDIRNQKESIDDLREGTKNLLIATSVLEEGIDVSVCDLVVCFDPPKNLRSFVQRRGRARKKSSKFVIFFEEDDFTTENKWTKMEDEMKEKYSNDQRVIEEIQALEEVKETGYEGMRIHSTGALLTLENARPHLSHFCDTLSCEFTDASPEFDIIGDVRDGEVSAKVILPSFLDPKFQEFYGISTWKTDGMAKRDAAFQAYVKLYEAGLVNDNLMPVHCQTPDEGETPPSEKRPGFAKVDSFINPWSMIANEWRTPKTFYQSAVEISSTSEILPTMLMILPVALPCNFTFKLFWNEEITFTASLNSQPKPFPADLVGLAVDTTHILLSSLFSNKMVFDRMDFPCLFIPDIQLTKSSIATWCKTVKGSILGSDVEKYNSESFWTLGLARRIDNSTRPWIVENCSWIKPKTDDDYADITQEEVLLHIEGKAWPKRTDFLHPEANTNMLPLHHTARKCHPARDCIIEKLPIAYTRFMLFVPHLIHNVEIRLLAKELSNTIFEPFGFKDLELVISAISSSAARESSNYQRLEFLGDSFLKLHASLQLSAKNPLWHEGLLSQQKDKIVSNNRLAKAAIQKGLDRFILTKPFTGAKWKPSYNSDHLERQNSETREMSTKVLADVVEALIGAATIDGGENMVLKCLQTFLPEVNWLPFDEQITLLYDDVIEFNDNSPHAMLLEIEDLIGYTFTKKSLLATALTHPSNRTRHMTYQRLEFLGDSILDTIISSTLFRSPKEFAHYDMHLMRTALVNADFLAFLCMSKSTDEQREEIAEISKGRGVKTIMSTKRIYLWQYMSHSASSDIVAEQQTTSARFNELRHDIFQALDSSNTYPWTLLSTLDAAKFFSDIIESILGAIFIDSHGSMKSCYAFLANIGLVQYLQRILHEDVDFMHPKQRLGLVAVDKTVQYDAKPVLVKKGVTRFTCTVSVGGEAVALVNDGISRIQAETKAADAALEVLRMR